MCGGCGVSGSQTPKCCVGSSILGPLRPGADVGPTRTAGVIPVGIVSRRSLQDEVVAPFTVLRTVQGPITSAHR